MAKHMRIILDNKNKVPCRNENKCFWRKVGGDTVLFSEDGQWLHQLNDVGSEIWNMCNGVFTVREIAEKLCNEYQVDANAACFDVLCFLEDLSVKNLIVYK